MLSNIRSGELSSVPPRVHPFGLIMHLQKSNSSHEGDEINVHLPTYSTYYILVPECHQFLEEFTITVIWL